MSRMEWLRENTEPSLNQGSHYWLMLPYLFLSGQMLSIRHATLAIVYLLRYLMVSHPSSSCLDKLLLINTCVLVGVYAFLTHVHITDISWTIDLFLAFSLVTVHLIRATGARTLLSIVSVSRDVIFNESDFPYHRLTQSRGLPAPTSGLPLANPPISSSSGPTVSPVEVVLQAHCPQLTQHHLVLQVAHCNQVMLILHILMFVALMKLACLLLLCLPLFSLSPLEWSHAP